MRERRANHLKTLFIFIAVLASAASLCGCNGGVAAPGGKLTLLAADNQPKDYPTTKGMYFMADEVARLSGGRIKMTVFPGGQFGNETMTIENTQMGTLDVNRVSCAPLTSFSHGIGALLMPYLFKDADHFWRALDNGRIFRMTDEGLQKQGLKLLAFYDSGSRSFYNKTRPVRTPDDLAGLKIRTQESPIMIGVVNTLGASATPMSYGEVYTSMQTGIIDGAENNAPSYDTSNHYEVAKFYSLTEHSRVPEAVVMSMKTWNRLTAPDREIVLAAAKASSFKQRELWKEKEAESMKKVISKGCKINEVDKAPFREKAKAMYDKYEADYGEMIKIIRALE